jgi:hypothetical protein
LCVKPNSTFPPIGGIVGATHWLKLRAAARKGAGAEKSLIDIPIVICYIFTDF